MNILADQKVDNFKFRRGCQCCRKYRDSVADYLPTNLQCQLSIQDSMNSGTYHQGVGRRHHGRRARSWSCDSSSDASRALSSGMDESVPSSTTWASSKLSRSWIAMALKCVAPRWRRFRKERRTRADREGRRKYGRQERHGQAFQCGILYARLCRPAVQDVRDARSHAAGAGGPRIGAERAAVMSSMSGRVMVVAFKPHG